MAGLVEKINKEFEDNPLVYFEDISEDRMAVIEEINSRLENHEFVRVFGKVVAVEPMYLYVDILGLKIRGRLSATKWRDCFTRTLVGRCRIGDCLEFAILSQIKREKDTPENPSYYLSRLGLADNPWDNIQRLNLQEGDAVTIECFEKPEGKTYWWGIMAENPEIEIMGDYSFSLPEGKIKVGSRYRCKIKQLVVDEKNPRNNRFSVVPFAMESEGK